VNAKEEFSEDDDSSDDEDSSEDEDEETPMKVKTFQYIYMNFHVVKSCEIFWASQFS